MTNQRSELIPRVELSLVWNLDVELSENLTPGCRADLVRAVDEQGIVTGWVAGTDPFCLILMSLHRTNVLSRSSKSNRMNPDQFLRKIVHNKFFSFKIPRSIVLPTKNVKFFSSGSDVSKEKQNTKKSRNQKCGPFPIREKF